MKEHFFSLVVPCYNTENTLVGFLDSVFAQNYKNFEVILVDDMSTDKTRAIMKNYALNHQNLKLFFLEEKGFAGGARNVGKDNSSGEIIVFLDADTKICSNYLQILNQAYNEYPIVAGIGGSVTNPYSTLMREAVHFLTMSNQLPLGKIRRVRTNPTINSSYRREYVKSLYFLERSTAAEDVLFDESVGKKGDILFHPGLMVEHYHPRTDYASMVSRQKFYARGFVMSRRLYDIRGSTLLKHKVLLLFLPRLMLISKRVMFSHYFFKFVLTFPIMLWSEIIRTKETLAYDKEFLANFNLKKEDFRMPVKSTLKYKVGN